MRYIICQKPGQFLLKEKPVPARGSNEALLKVKKVGICGTDLHAFSGNQAYFTYPRILGHELAGEVVEIGENHNGIKAGDKVVIMPYVSCGSCIACRNGKTNCCSSIEVLGVHRDGGMQEYIIVHEDLLIPCSGLSYEEMAIVEPLAIGAHALRRAQLTRGETIMVVGCGPIGIGIMKLAQLAEATVIAVDVNQDRLSYAKEKIGVDHIIHVGNNALAQTMEITNQDLATAVFDATGHKGALESGIKYMSHGGRYVLVGLAKGDLVFNHPAIHAKEATIMCSRNATIDDFKQVIQVLETGQFPVESYVTHMVPFTDMIAHFDSWLRPESSVIKAMVDF